MGERVDEQKVKVGQVWADCDWRCAGRTLRVTAVSATHAECIIVTDSTAYPPQKPRVGKSTRVRLDRFRSTSTGYRLLPDERS